MLCAAVKINPAWSAAIRGLVCSSIPAALTGLLSTYPYALNSSRKYRPCLSYKKHVLCAMPDGIALKSGSLRKKEHMVKRMMRLFFHPVALRAEPE